MAENNAPGLTWISLTATISLSFMVWHIYKFDQGKCLIPRRKDWFRCLLTWMLVLSNISLLIFAYGWLCEFHLSRSSAIADSADVKTMLGWVQFGPEGARPWPSALFPARYSGFNAPLTVFLSICYALQASLNAEEGLYWAHLMKIVSRPRAAKPFLKSYYFAAWVLITIAVLAVQIAVPWIGFNGDLTVQLSKELLVGGVLEMIVVCASTIIVYRFPKFLVDVAASGAGPDVRARLYFYQEANKTRTLFRFVFTISALILGADGMTTAQTVNLNPLASDIIITLMVGSLCLVMMISIILYLPRLAPSAAQNKVMVGQQPNHGDGFALATLLREAGHWDEIDGDAASAAGIGGRRDSSDAPFANTDTREASWGGGGEEKWQQRQAAAMGPAVPQVLESFSSPFAVSTEAQPQRPVEIRIHVEREVHKD